MEVGWGLTADWWMLDIVPSETWSTVPALPATPRQYCAGFNFDEDDKGYLFGGLDAIGPLNELWSFSETTNSWTQLASLPGPGRYASTAFVIDDKAYIASGMFANGSPTNECWQYVPDLDSWTQVANVPGPPRHRAAAFSGSFGMVTYGFVVGGADSTFNALSDNWKYDADADLWSSAAPLPEPRYGADAISPDWPPILVGGASNDTTFHANAWSYDIALDGWTNEGNVLPFGLRGGAIAYASGGGGWHTLVYGTGIDSALVRHKEVFKTGYAFGINEHSTASLQLHPNPGTSHLTLTGLPSAPVEVAVADAQGRRLFVGDRLIDHTIDASAWNRGIYFVSAVDPAGRSYRARWIRQ